MITPGTAKVDLQERWANSKPRPVQETSMPMLLAVDITVDTILRFSAGKKRRAAKKHPQKIGLAKPVDCPDEAMLKKRGGGCDEKIAADVTAVARMI